MSYIGPVMLDIESFELTLEDETILAHPLVGGVILFSRNVTSVEQVQALTQSIRAIKSDLIIAVDQEGGRVQRFKTGFSQLPAMARLGDWYQKQGDCALSLASDLGELMALEVQSVGCDISFAPVLDLGLPQSQIIGDRAFSAKADEIILLAGAFIDGMAKAGMAATGKHFPGHGSVVADSHLDIPVDYRSLQQIESLDLRPFAELAHKLKAVMPAHIIYPEISTRSAGFCPVWLQTILRQKLGFEGVIFSDDLSMKGAETAGNFVERAHAALNAGCDMLLVCNDRPAALTVLQGLEGFTWPEKRKSTERLAALIRREPPVGLAQLKQSQRWFELRKQLACLF